MSKLILAAVGVLFGVNTAMCAVDWSKVTGAYEVPEGASEVVTDVDLPYVNALTKLTVNGAVRFDTTMPPTMPLAGTGVCSKTNGSDWTVSVAWPDWKGIWTFDGEMMINYEAAQALGNYGLDSDGNPLSEAQFRNGATLNLSKKPSGSKGWIYGQRIRISGTGKGGKGAIYASGVNSTSPAKQIGNIVLDGDATITAKYFIYLTDGTLDLNGHKLTYSAEDSTTHLLEVGAGQKIAGPGEIELAAGVGFLVYSTDQFQFADASPRTKLTLLGDNPITFSCGESASCDWPDQYFDLVARGQVSFVHLHSNKNGSAYPTAEAEDCGIVIHGNVSLPESTDVLTVSSIIQSSPTAVLPKCPITFDGEVTGLGTLKFADGASGLSPVFRLTGKGDSADIATYFNLSKFGTMRLDHPGSVGAFDKLTVVGGHLAPAVGSEEKPWTTNELAQLVREATFSGNSVVLALDASSACDGTNDVKAAFWDAFAPDNLCLGSFAGTVSLFGPLTERGRLVAAGGTLRLTGDDPIVLSKSGSKTLNFAKTPGVLLVDQASAVTIPANGSVSLPLADAAEIGSEKYGQGGRMVVSNATLAIETPTVGSDVWTSQADRVLTVGATRGTASSYGVLEVGSGADITGKITLGQGANDVGAVFQTGGTVRNIGQYANGKRDRGPILANGGRGYLEIDGGVWEQHGRTECAYAEGSAFLLNLKSGSFSAVKHMLDPTTTEKGWGARFFSHGGYAHFYVSGGTVCTWGAAFQDAASVDDTVVITLDGPDAKFVTKDNLAYNAHVDATGDFIVNFNDGVWRQEADGVYLAPGGEGPVRAFMNFNGGTVQSTVRFTFNDGRENLRMTVFAGGATFDAVGEGDVRLRRPLCAPKGKGVSAIPLPDGLADEIFICPPAVRIAETGTDGTGAGASAIALWDRATGKVTGFKVTGSGDGYTEATATISYGASRSWTQVCTLADNVRTGGLVKTGTGTLYLYAEGSDYCGPTEVREGEIEFNADYALPSNGVLVLNGGSVNLVSYAAKFAAVGGTGGTLVAKAARTMEFDRPLAGTTAGFQFEKIVPSFVGDWTISAAEILAGTATAEYDADVTFGSEATVTIDNFAMLDTDEGRAGSPYVLFKVTDGKTLTGMPTWTNPPTDGSWKLKCVANAIKLVHRKGLMMVVR